MRVAIDKVGRVVIPKPMRDALGIEGTTELELTAADGKLELTVPDSAAHVEVRDGLAVIVIEPEPPPLDQETVRSVLESVRK
jgi:AbrB family looped-hinge helix DNA binding protein